MEPTTGGLVLALLAVGGGVALGVALTLARTADRELSGGRLRRRGRPRLRDGTGDQGAGAGWDVDQDQRPGNRRGQQQPGHQAVPPPGQSQGPGERPGQGEGQQRSPQRAQQRSQRQQPAPALSSAPDPALLPRISAAVVPPVTARVLSVLKSNTVVVDDRNVVVQASPSAYALGLVRAGRLRNADLAEAVRAVRSDGQTRNVEFETGGGGGRPPVLVQARVAAINAKLILVLATDLTQERRVEMIRRDFVANVSHELKTPIGALTLLAEAVHEAREDPEAVARFAARMQTEAGRLKRLVQQIIDLSRLQNEQALEHPGIVDVDAVVESSVEALDVEAKAKQIDIVHGGRRMLQVLGNPAQIELALGNLLSNAVTYSPEHSTITVSAMPVDSMVEINVTDQGIGIPAGDLERIFERFYRVDPSRHRSTGGTGLGLSIVKHVAAVHGGEVTVWSEPGQGSSFTLRLPRHTPSEQTPPGASARHRLEDEHDPQEAP